MKQVIKRDGKEVKFNLKKIVSAIRRAGESSCEFGYDEALDLTNSVIQMFDNKEKATVEEIQDAVEKVLNENNYTKTARAFIVYREKHNDMRKDNNVMIDAVQSIDDYLDRSDWRVNANANQGYSLGGMILNTSGKVTANYWLSHVYPKEAGEAHRNGDIQIHDLDMLANYCTGWSLRALLQEGFNGVKGKVESKPPKHLASALGQMVNFWGCLQNENAGAQAFSSFDTYLAPYVRNDKLTYKQVYDAIQEFVFNVNVPSRWGCVLPDTEILTKNGWKKYTDLKLAEDIVGFRDGELVDDVVNKINVFNFEGKLVKIKTASTVQVLTPTHRVIGKDVNNIFHTINAEDFFDNKELKLPVLYDGLTSVDYEDVVDVEWYDYEGKVWCPSTDCTFWVAKNGNSIFITGNTQTPFTNITLDWTCPEDLKDSQPIIAGEEMDYTYSELQPEMDMINKAFIEVMIKGDAHGRLFTFPIPTYNITPDFPWESENTKLLFEMTAKYGLPYFQNFLNSDLKVGDVRSMCPLTGDTEVLVHINGESKHIDIGTLFTKYKENNTFSFDVWNGQKWCKAKPNYQGIQKYLIVKTDVGLIIKMGLNHIQCLYDGSNKLGSELEVGDRLPYVKDLTSTTSGNSSCTIVSIEKSINECPLYCMEVQNDSHLFTLANGLLTHNCRLQLDLREIKKRGGGLFGSGEQTGSIGVITINCARLGYLFKNDITGLYKRLDELMNIARNALEQKRKSLNKWMEQGLYPYSKRYLGGYNTLFSTIGINGVNEMIRNFTNDEHDITDDYGQKFAMSLMDHINEVLKQFQVETGNLYNLEATPGEGTTFRFAKEDKKRYPEIIQAGKPEAPYYTNSTQIPVGYTNDPFTALNLQEGLQRRYSGGTVVHLYMGEAMSSSDSCKTLVKRVLENYHIPYLTITPTFSICPKHGYISGEHKYCPICDEELTSPKQEQCKACKG